MARYLEARRARRRRSRRRRASPTARPGCRRSPPALRRGAPRTARSLVTEFRGFRDFGLIGGVGMLLCWIATYRALPSILAVIERVLAARHADEPSGPRRPSSAPAPQGGVAFGTPFAALVPTRAAAASRSSASRSRSPALVATVALRARAIRWSTTSRNLRTDASARAEEIRLTKLGEDDHRATSAPTAWPSSSTAPSRSRRCARRSTRAATPRPTGKKPFKGVHTLQDFVPAEQEAKIPILLEHQGQARPRAQARAASTTRTGQTIAAVLPPDDLAPFGIADLPDGARARRSPRRTARAAASSTSARPSAELVDDAHYLFRWADSYRETRAARRRASCSARGAR